MRRIGSVYLHELNEDTAHRVGRILAQACTSDVVDGSVVAAAIVRSAAVLTSNRADIAHLLQATGSGLIILDV